MLTYIKDFGLLRGTSIFLVTASKSFIIRFTPRLADWIVSKRKGNCNCYGNCCPPKCPNLMDDGLCAIYQNRKGTKWEHCIYSPFPLDLTIFGHPKWKKCKYRY